MQFTRPCGVEQQSARLSLGQGWPTLLHVQPVSPHDPEQQSEALAHTWKVNRHPGSSPQTPPEQLSPPPQVVRSSLGGWAHVPLSQTSPVQGLLSEVQLPVLLRITQRSRAVSQVASLHSFFGCLQKGSFVVQVHF
jgi:hypothetical protein